LLIFKVLKKSHILDGAENTTVVVSRVALRQSPPLNFGQSKNYWKTFFLCENKKKFHLEM